MIKEKISIIVPTRGHLDNLDRLIKSLKENTSDPSLCQLVLRCDLDDPTLVYTSIIALQWKNTTIISEPRSRFLGSCWEDSRKAANGDILMVGVDDLVFSTKNWDEKIREVFAAYGDRTVMVFCNDGVNGDKFAAYPFLHRCWVDIVGYLVRRDFHYRSNLWIDHLARMVNRATYIPDVKIEHLPSTQSDTSKAHIKDIEYQRFDSLRWSIDAQAKQVAETITNWYKRFGVNGHPVSRIFVSIANYGIKSRNYLMQVLQEYANLRTKYHIDIEICATDPLEIQDVTVCYFDKTIGHELTWQHRSKMVENQDKYDLFIYQEDDLQITGEHIDAFLEQSRFLPPEYIAGFIHYEPGQDGHKYLMPSHPMYPAFDKELFIGGKRYCTMVSQHQGFWMMLRQHLKRAISSGHFSLQPRRFWHGLQFYHLLEGAASEPYTLCGMQKVIPEDVDRHMIWHMPNSYHKPNMKHWDDPVAKTHKNYNDTEMSNFTLAEFKAFFNIR